MLTTADDQQLSSQDKMKFEPLNATVRLNQEMNLKPEEEIFTDDWRIKAVAPRRILKHAQANIVPLEYVRLINSRYHDAFPRIKMPFLAPNIIDSNDVFIKAAADSLSDAFDWDQQSEYEYEKFFASKILGRLFKDCPMLEVSTQFIQRLPKSSNKSKAIADIAVHLNDEARSVCPRKEIRRKLAEIPIVIIECAAFPTLPQTSHKDFAKICSSMAYACMEWIRYIAASKKPTSKDLFTDIFVQGILIGGMQMEFLILIPYAEEVRSDGRIKMSFLVESNREQFRFSMYTDSVYNPDLASEQFCCHLSEGLVVVEPVLKFPPVRNSAKTSFNKKKLEKLKLKAKLAKVKSPSATSAASSASSEASKLSFLAHKSNWDKHPGESKTAQKLLASSSKLPMNQLVLYALTGVRGMVMRFVEFLTETFKIYDGPVDPSDPFKDWEPAFTPSSAVSSKAVSPVEERFFPLIGKNNVSSKPASSSLSRSDMDVDMSAIRSIDSSSGSNCHFKTRCSAPFLDSFGEWVTVIKRRSRFEVAVFETMNDSDFVPRLHPKIRPQPTALQTLTLESVVPLREILGISFQAYLFKLKSDCQQSLEAIHAAGYVHSDISPNNIGFNRRLNRWQVFDFNHAMPLELSLKTRRTAGTEGFVSSDAKKTGIFGPIDDFIALEKAVQYVKEKLTPSGSL